MAKKLDKKALLLELKGKLAEMDKKVGDVRNGINNVWDKLKKVKSNDNDITKTAMFFAESLEDAESAISDLVEHIDKHTKELGKDKPKVERK
jgi:archaellum component FlaC